MNVEDVIKLVKSTISMLDTDLAVFDAARRGEELDWMNVEAMGNIITQGEYRIRAINDQLKKLSKILTWFQEESQDVMKFQSEEPVEKGPIHQILDILCLEGKVYTGQEIKLGLAAILHFWLNSSMDEELKKAVQAITSILQSKDDPYSIKSEDTNKLIRVKGLLRDVDLREASEKLKTLLVCFEEKSN